MGIAKSVFLNSGIFGPPIELTVDGYDLQFGTNVLGMYFLGRLLLSHISDERSLGHFYFTKLLLPALLTATKSSPGVGGRVVNTTSVMHHFQDLDFNTFKDGPARKKMGSFRLYYQSKFVCHMIIAIVTTKFCGGFIDVLSRAMSCSLRRLLGAMAIKELYQPLCTQVWIDFGIIEIQIYSSEAGPVNSDLYCGLDNYQKSIFVGPSTFPAE